MSRPIGEAGLALIKRWEGCRLYAYKPVREEPYWTIGWGHYGPDIKEGQVITQAQADAMLVADVQRYADYVDNPAYCPVTKQLSANQRDALISFTYNCGAGNLKTLCRNRTPEQIVAAIPLYNKDINKKVLQGLVRRRAAEVELFNKEVDEVDWSRITAADIQKMPDAAIDALLGKIQMRQAAKPISGTMAVELQEAVAAGITDGSNPQGYATRAQAAIMAKRAVRK